MLRASLFAMSASLFAVLSFVPVAMAGPHHHSQQRPSVRGPVAFPVGARVPVSRPMVRPALPARPVIVGYPLPAYPVLGWERQVIVTERPTPHPANVTVTINPVPVVMGIRRPPEAAPVIYRIADQSEGRLMRHHQHRRMAPAAGIHQLQPDTTTPRVVIVRGR